MAFLLLEGSIRVIAKYHHGVRALLYNPDVTNDYSTHQTLQQLMDSSVLGFKPHINFYGYTLNSRSFRTPEYALEKNPETFRIVTIGDSFTAASGGVPYPLHWTTLLGEILRQRTGRDIEIINLGVPGVEPWFELRLWQIEAAPLQPDLVVLGFCVGNDIPLPLDSSQETLGTKSFEESLREVSKAVRLTRNLWAIRDASPAIWSYRESASSVADNGVDSSYVYDPNQATYSADAFHEIVWRRMRAAYEPNINRLTKGAALLEPVMTTFRAEVEAQESKFFVVLIPDEYQLYDDLLTTVARLRSQNPKHYMVDRPQNYIGRMLSDNAIDYIDLLPDFAENAENKSLYRLRDTHWNATGNELAASLIAEALLGRIR